MRQEIYTVLRPWEPGTGATVSFETALPLTAMEARDKIKTAVTSWVKYTDKGKEAWEYSSGDFNLGDLVGYLQDAELEAYLKAQGIYSLSIETFSHESLNWEFDNILVDEEQLP